MPRSGEAAGSNLVFSFHDALMSRGRFETDCQGKIGVNIHRKVSFSDGLKLVIRQRLLLNLVLRIRRTGAPTDARSDHRIQ